MKCKSGLQVDEFTSFQVVNVSHKWAGEFANLLTWKLADCPVTDRCAL